ncbi:MAG: hypothetical protein ACJ74Y_14180 [Bryobacteraceae bacterium]|jgi:hypothetical protein
MFRTVQVTPLPSKKHPIAYQARYKKFVAYGRTPKQAVDRVSQRYHDNRFRLRDIPNMIGISLLPPH